MNEDHRDDALLIVRTLGGVPQATDVMTTGVDGAGMTFRVAGGDELIVPFGRSVSERAHVRLAVVDLYERARVAAGVPPRPH